MRVAILIVAFTLCSALATVDDKPVLQKEPAEVPFHPDKQMMKGRLTSVHFVRRTEPRRVVVSLYFVVDEPYAMLPQVDVSGEQLARVVTDLPMGDLEQMNRQNYVQTMEAMLPIDLCIVIGASDHK